MKILLIYPYFLEERIHSEDIEAVPIGLYSVAAVLKESEYDVEVMNWCKSDRVPKSIPEILRKKRPQVIGFSIVNGNRWGAIEIARTAKKMDPEVKIVFGGIGAHFLWEHLLNHFPEIDYIVLGEGEYAFLKLIRFLETGREGNPAELMGVAFRSDGKAIRNGVPEPIADLDALPIPADYFHYQHVSSSRGCTWKCTFCGSPRFWGKRIRWRSPEHFVREVEVLYKKGVRFFYFSDDTFTVSKERVIEICKRIIQKDLKITWFAISRVNYVNEEVLLWMRKAGCLQISYGIESGSEKIRQALNKQIKTGHVKKAFALTTKYGILARAYFIYGSPVKPGRLSRRRSTSCMRSNLSARFSTSSISSPAQSFMSVSRKTPASRMIFGSKRLRASSTQRQIQLCRMTSSSLLGRVCEKSTTGISTALLNLLNSSTEKTFMRNMRISAPAWA
jgi:anaerobic magnesium-protoporphyrin IX monomethyl ester cyclase